MLALLLVCKKNCEWLGEHEFLFFFFFWYKFFFCEGTQTQTVLLCFPFLLDPI